jgi:hypothetical protein
MKKVIMVASACAMLLIAQNGFSQATQETKAAKKEMKAEKKMAKANELNANAATHKGLEVAGVSDPNTRNAKADRKMEKAQKKEMKADAKEMKAAAKTKKKQAANVN